MKAAGIAALLVVAVGSLAAPAAAQPLPALVRISVWSAPAEVTGLTPEGAERVRGLWAEFVDGVPAHSECLRASPPRFVAKSDMAPRAAYAPASATLYVTPGDLDRLVVFHELAHHLDFACGAAEAVGGELRAAQGIAPGRAWWKQGSPATWPAEYFANAVAIALGENSRHDVRPETVEVVEAWMGRVEAAERRPVGAVGAQGADVARVS